MVLTCIGGATSACVFRALSAWMAREETERERLSFEAMVEGMRLLYSEKEANCVKQ